MIAPLVEQIAALKPDMILHSDMARTRSIALPLAQQLGLSAQGEPLWRERDFGTWEGQSWQRIYRATGNAMDGMIDAPDTFRPGGNGETTSELAARIATALASLAKGRRIAIISHGGPIAAARQQLSSPEHQPLVSLIPATGTFIRVPF